MARRGSLIALKSIEVSFSRSPGYGKRGPIRVGKDLETCSILTTTANTLTAPFHDRMPLILDPQCYDLWLDPGTTDTTVISKFLKPFDARLMSCFPVSPRVNRPAHDDPECSAPVEITRPQGVSFRRRSVKIKTQRQERNESTEGNTS